MSADKMVAPSREQEERPRVRSRVLRTVATLRGQLIVPYVVLTLITAMVGLYVVTRLVTSTVRERFVNQLYEASRVAADGVVRREKAHLRALRLMAFSEGVPEAFASRDEGRLAALLRPLALNEGIETVVALDPEGHEIVGLVQGPGSTQHRITRGSDFADRTAVRRVLNGESDQAGDKFVEVMETAFGSYLFTSAPVHDEAGTLVGVLLAGTKLETLAAGLKGEAFADVAMLDRQGHLAATTLPEPEGGSAVLELDGDSVRRVSATELREISLYGRVYQAAFSPWWVRDQKVGFLEVILPSNFIVATEATSRNWFSVVFSVGTVAVFALGYILSQSIARPILRLRSMAQAVAAGDLAQSSGLRRRDEIGDLAHAFDVMAQRLQERTAEAERLYKEAVERNRELAEMYEQLQAAQQQLIQSEKLAAVGQLAAGIVHDVKNPLGVIKGMAEELLEEVAESKEAVEFLRVIRDNASRANAIVSDLLKFARQSTPELKRHDLRESVEGALRLTGYLLRKGRVEVKTDLPDEPLYLTYDPQQIQQVLINVIQNAVQAMPEGGEIRIAVEPEEAGASVAITDSGYGIEEQHLPRIFDPFFTTKPEGQGTGMGLSVSYGIVRRHGGTIDVESRPGAGSTFVIRLPSKPPEPQEVKEPAA